MWKMSGMCVCVCVCTYAFIEWGMGWSFIHIQSTYKDLEAWRSCLAGSGLYLALCFAMVYVRSLNYFLGARISPVLLNERDIVLLIHSHPSSPVNRMWADRKKSNYFSTWAQPEQNSFGVLALWSVCSHHTITFVTWWNKYWRGQGKYLRKRSCDNF